MGRFGAFKFELVEAETKKPFKEHVHAGKVYCEAEPGAEYFVSIQKLDKTETDLYVAFSVDGGNDLACLHYSKTSVDKEAYYLGIMRIENGVSTTTALEFVKPNISESSNMNERLMMGNVVIKVKEMVYTGRVVPSFNSNGSKFKAATVDLNNGGASKKKNLRSAEGSTSYSKNYPTATNEVEIRGLVDTVTLHYCAALGLMEVGVLKKPDMWAYHRLKHPAKAGSNPMAVQGANEENKSVDLSKLNDSDDED